MTTYSSTSASIGKRKVGRPKKPRSLIVDMLILAEHARLRKSGLGRLKAIAQTVENHNRKFPGEKIYSKLVKAVLTEFQAEKTIEAFLVEASEDGARGAVSIGYRPTFGKRGRQTSRKKPPP